VKGIKKETKGAIKMKNLITVLAISIFVGNYAYAANTASFNATMSLRQGINVTNTKALDFGIQVQGTAADITVGTGDGGAATFTATGGRNRDIVSNVVEASISMINASDAGSTIVVDTFTVDGPTHFENDGTATGFKAGATAHIEAADTDGEYLGSATFRVAYN
jgi:hypothetical protein